MNQLRRDPRYPHYNDGLDEDGYPIKEVPRLRYRHGSEEEAGDWHPVPLFVLYSEALTRVSHIMELSPNCDSPIEAEIGAAVIMFFDRANLPLKLCKMLDVRAAPGSLLLVPQFAWSYYRSDWAIMNPKRTGALLIECDGKDFHSSPAQKAHDRKKDAAALDYGYLTLRFTGSQIHRDADGCAQKIFDAVCGL